MTNRNTFHVVRLIDLFTFGGPALLATGLTVWAGLTPGNAAIGIVIAALAAAGFAFVLAMIVARRFAFARDIVYTTRHGLICMRSEWTPLRLRVEQETARVILLWERAVAGEAANPALVRKALRDVIVRWARAPFTLVPAFTGWAGRAAPASR